jgi:nucleoside triphosphate diphosphatase
MADIDKLLEVMVALRRDCPWDRQQDFASVAPYTVEEAYEVADAIAREDWPGLRGELGDLLFQVVFHSRMAAEAGHFDFNDVVEAICEKMVRRHPHVFGTDEERQRGAVAGDWESIKAAERAADSAASVLDGVTVALPALSRAAKLGKRAARVGFDWPDQAGVEAKITEEIEELREARQHNDKAAVQHELGDLLFAVVNWARHLKLDPEQALTDANRRFEQRFRLLEKDLARQGRALADCDLDTLEAAWTKAKQRLDTAS